MARFHQLVVKDIKRETPECVSIALDVPTSLQPEFTYKQGQYITFKLEVNGEEIRRSYSLCSSPVADQEIRVAVKMVENGKGSNYLNKQLKTGDQVSVMSPTGNFFSELNAANQIHYHLFAGGSGITPMFSIIKSVLAIEPSSKITLYYGNKDEQSTIFYQALNDLAGMNASRFAIHYVFQQSSSALPDLNQGIMNKEKNAALISQFVNPAEKNEFFICGPGPMMEAAKEALLEKAIPMELIHIEYFTAPAQEKKIEENSHGRKNAKATIILDGDEFQLEIKANESILEAALRMNIDAPYACQGGSCCTCRAKLMEGKVEMEVNYALLDKEVIEGFILTCQSYALTDHLVVDYDRGK